MIIIYNQNPLKTTPPSPLFPPSFPLSLPFPLFPPFPPFSLPSSLSLLYPKCITHSSLLETKLNEKPTKHFETLHDLPFRFFSLHFAPQGMERRLEGGGEMEGRWGGRGGVVTPPTPL